VLSDGDAVLPQLLSPMFKTRNHFLDQSGTDEAPPPHTHTHKWLRESNDSPPPTFRLDGTSFDELLGDCQASSR